jgi:N-acetylglutamate synthase-like GNAT family acetyltransferase
MVPLKMAKNIHLRQMQKADLTAVYELVRNTIQISYADTYPPEAIAFFRNYHSQENILEDLKAAYIVVAESAGQIVGTGTLSGMDIGRVFIDPAHQHQGIGKMIAAELGRKARSTGLAKLERSSSLKAREFWESEGFEIVKEFALPVVNDKQLLYYEMTKTLLAYLTRLVSSP